MGPNELDVRQLPEADRQTIASPLAGVVSLHTGPSGALLRSPRRPQHQFTADPDGMRYSTVHKRNETLVPGRLESPVRRAV